MLKHQTGRELDLASGILPRPQDLTEVEDVTHIAVWACELRGVQRIERIPVQFKREAIREVQVLLQSQVDGAEAWSVDLVSAQRSFTRVNSHLICPYDDGYVVRVNGSHTGAFGPLIADTDTSYSWNLGVYCGYSYALTTSRYGWIVQGTAARSWFDGCKAGPGNSGINSDTSAVSYTFNSAGAQVSSNSGVFAAYVPT